MIANLKPYAEYKQSGLPWLGQVPGHWEVAPVGRYFRVKSGDMITPKDERDDGVPIYGGNGVRGYTYQSNTTGPVLLLGRVGAKCGCVHFVAGDIWASEHALRVLFKTPSNLQFYMYLLNHADLNRLAIRTAQPLINSTIVRSYRATLPPPDEQAAIVRFLDWANGRLERAIRAKRKVIALLNEQKQAIIHRAVTRGLDATVPLKPSGIPWLGDIPQHWEVRRIKHLLREVDERSSTGSEPLLSMRMHHGLVLFADHFTRPPQAATLIGFKIVRPGQFVVNRMQAGNGVIFASALTGLVSPDYAVFDPIGDANVDFLGELFRSRKVRAKFRAESKGLGTGTSGFLRLYNDRLGAIHVALPPREEQGAILSGLAEELSGANTTISRFEREIELLREYRTRLVADVVTGKLDVREAAASLPQETPLETVESDTDQSLDPETADEESSV